MPQSTRKNRNDANPPAMPPLDFAAAAGVSGFPTDNTDQFHMNNGGYAGFGNAFTNPFHTSRTNTSHHQSGTFNQNPFGMSGFGMTGPYTNAYPSYGMMGQSMKHQHTDNTATHHTQRQHHGHNQHHDSFGQVTAFSSDPSISFISQTATNTNPYTQNATASNAQSHHNFDTLSSISSTASRHKNTNPSTTYDPFNNPSHSASDLFATSSHRRHHGSSSQADLSVLSYGTGNTQQNNNNSSQNNGNTTNNASGSSSNHNTRNSLRSSHYNSSSSNTAKHNEYVKHAFASPNLLNNTSNLRSNAHTSSTSHHRAINNQSNTQHIFAPYADPTQQHLYGTASANSFGLLPQTSQATHLTHSHNSHGTSKKTHSKSNRTHRTSSVGKINRSKSYSSPKKPHFKKSKNKNVYDETGKYLLQTNKLHTSSKLSEVTGVERLSLHHNPPVDGCHIEPYVILTCENGGFIQSDDKDCRFTWYRSKKRLCFARNCKKPAFLQCLSCCKLKIDHDSSYYCSTQCMQAAWAQHKDIHNMKDFDYDLTKWNSIDAAVTNEWKVKNARECDKFVENPDTLYCKFPPPIINKWEKIHNNTSKKYKPRSDDIGRQLLLECAPTNLHKLGVHLQLEKEQKKLIAKLKSAKDAKTKSKDKKDSSTGKSDGKDTHKDRKNDTKTDKKSTKKDTKKKRKSIINECQDTSPCLPRPQLSHDRLMRYYHPQSHPSDQEDGSIDDFTFRVLSYNCLAPIYCTQAMYPYVEPYKLEWDYRKYNIKREILRYNPDVICLQEVQHNHFDDYFTKELSKEGYEGMYRPKSRGNRDPKSVDGCAIFFKSDRFKVSSRYHIDFNDTSNLYLNMLQNGSESGKPMTDEQAKIMSKRLMKGNIAMIVVLEERERKSSKSKDKKEDKEKKDADKDDHKTNNDKSSSKKKDNKPSINISEHNLNSSSMNRNVKKEIVIANTHVYWDPNFTDVKIWQAWILCEEIWRALGRELPLILCGDFNSEPKSAVYEYLTKGRVDLSVYDQMVKEYEVKKNCILPPRDHLRHTLGLKSHYNRNGEEPIYTNYTRHYKGTLDYVLYSSKSIEAIGYLQEPSEDVLSLEEAIPDSMNSSDHIPLMGTFAFTRDYQNWKRERRQSQSQSQHISSSKSSKYHHHHHHHSGHHGHSSSSTSSHPHAHSHSRGSSSRFAASTSSSSNSSTIRPSAPPRHRQHGQSPQHSRILPSPSNLTKSQSSTHSTKPAFASTLRRHHSLEVLQNTNASSSSGGKNNNNSSSSTTPNPSSNTSYASPSRSSPDKKQMLNGSKTNIKRTKIDNTANIVIPPHIDDEDTEAIDEKIDDAIMVLGKKRMKIQKLASRIQSKQRGFDSTTLLQQQQQQQRVEAQKNYYQQSYYPQMPYSQHQQAAYALYQQQMRMKMMLNQQDKTKYHQKPVTPNKNKKKNTKPIKYDDDFKGMSK
eukprot:168453_1